MSELRIEVIDSPVLVESSGDSTVVVETDASAPATTVEVIHPGPQGPQGPPGIQGEPGMGFPTIASLLDTEFEGAVDRSLLYYDSSRELVVADAEVTTSTLTDGGNF
jgi:hypothetical protein